MRDVEFSVVPEVEGTVKSFSDHRNFGFVFCDAFVGDGRFPASLEVSSLNNHSLFSAPSDAFQQGLEVESILFGFPAKVGDTLRAAWLQLLRRSILHRQPQQSLLLHAESRPYRLACLAWGSHIVGYALVPSPRLRVDGGHHQ